MIFSLPTTSSACDNDFVTCRKARVWERPSWQMIASLDFLIFSALSVNFFKKSSSFFWPISSSRSTSFWASHSSWTNSSRICWYTVANDFLFRAAAFLDKETGTSKEMDRQTDILGDVPMPASEMPLIQTKGPDQTSVSRQIYVLIRYLVFTVYKFRYNLIQFYSPRENFFSTVLCNICTIMLQSHRMRQKFPECPAGVIHTAGSFVFICVNRANHTTL